MRNFLVGALCGAAVAILYAPMTGRRTRALLRDKATKVGNDTSDFIEAKKRHMANKMEGYKHKARKMMQHAAESIPGYSASPEEMDRTMVGMGEPSI